MFGDTVYMHYECDIIFSFFMSISGDVVLHTAEGAQYRTKSSTFKQTYGKNMPVCCHPCIDTDGKTVIESDEVTVTWRKQTGTD